MEYCPVCDAMTDFQTEEMVNPEEFLTDILICTQCGVVFDANMKPKMKKKDAN